MKRKCGECTGCCEGWLADTVWGRAMYPGKSCYFLKNKKCSIYETRPNNPCRNFYCGWVKETEFPDWMRPDKSGVILADRVTDSGEKYLMVLPTYKKIDPDVFSFLNQIKTKRNIKLIFDGQLENLCDLELSTEENDIIRSKEI